MSKLEGEQDRVGFDLDGTLAEFTLHCGDEYNPTSIGRPIPYMVEVAKAHMRQGDTVVIFTARVHPSHGADAFLSEDAIRKWCIDVFGCELEVTCMKDAKMRCFYDDRAISVSPNRGAILTVGYREPRIVEADSLGELLER